MKNVQATTLAAVCIAGLAYTSPIQAQERRTVVKTDDLMLQVPADRREFVDRIHAAAVRLCGPQPYSLSSRRTDDDAKCVRQSVHRAMASLPVFAQEALREHTVQRLAGVR